MGGRVRRGTEERVTRLRELRRGDRPTAANERYRLETTSNRGADEVYLNCDAGRTTMAVLDVEPAKREWRVRDLCASRRLVRIGASERGSRDRDFVSESRSEWCSNKSDFETGADTRFTAEAELGCQSATVLLDLLP